MHDRPELGIDRSKPVDRIALSPDGSSWVDLVPGFIRDPEPLLATLIETTDWLQGEVWRYEKYVEEKRLGSWGRADTLAAPLRQAGLHLDSVYRVRFQGASIVYYRDGNDFQGLHSDREMRWLDDTLIGIVVLGESRPFQLRPRRNVNDPSARRDDSQDVVLRPGHGDLLVMGGRCQQDWLHGVPADATQLPRISVTWRWTSRGGRPDTAPSYFDGRSYSDGPSRVGTRYRRPTS